MPPLPPTAQDTGDRGPNDPAILALLSPEQGDPPAPPPEPEDLEDQPVPEDEITDVDEPPAEDAPEDDDDTSEDEPLETDLSEDDLRFLKRWPEADREVVLALSPEVRKVTVDRLRKFESGLDKRAQAAAEERSRKEQELNQAFGQTQQMFTHLQQRSAQVDQALDLMEALQATGVAPTRPDASMMQTDFIGYQEQLERYTRFNEAAQALQAEKARIAQDTEAHTTAQRDTIIRHEAKMLVDAVPELQTDDPEARSSFVRGMTQVMRKFGAHDQELQNLHDHRIWKLAAYAYRMERGQAVAKAALEKRGSGSQTPAAVKSTPRARGGATQTTTRKAADAAREQMRKSGKPSDVANWLTASEKGAKGNGR